MEGVMKMTAVGFDVLLTVWLFVVASVHFSLCDEGRTNFGVVILSQPNPYHQNKANLLRQNLYDQAGQLDIPRPTVLLSHEQWPYVTGAWTILPIIPLLVDEFSETVSAILFCEDNLAVNLSRLMKRLAKIDLKKELFLGRALTDKEATIIHHFAFHEDPSSFLYPDFAAGFILSVPLLRRLEKRLEGAELSTDFTIDAQHELALFIWDKGNGVALTDVKYLCGYSTKPGKCATRQLHKAPDCGHLLSDSELFFAVKTCKKFHNDRVPVLKSTWGKGVRDIKYFSDVDDSSIPTTTLGIPNTERGHCAKFMAILNYVYNLPNSTNYKWVIIADDDTLLSVARLKKLLSCYDPESLVVVGERYGYGVVKGIGYNYITLGGGMALSHTTLRQLIESDECHCATDDSPDDMTFGLCLKHLNIALTHSPLFHQARPVDYADGYLANQEPISFHRHWMIDPIQVYKQWLLDDRDHKKENKNENSSRSHKDHSTIEDQRQEL